MHNSVTRRFNDQQRDRFNATLLENTLSSHMYNVWIPASEFHAIGATATNYSTTPTFNDVDDTHPGGWEFADAQDQAVGLYWRKHREWRSGIVTIRPHLYSEATSGVHVIAVNIYPLSHGDSLTTWPLPTNSKTWTAPGTAGQIYIMSESEYLGNADWTAAVDDGTDALQIMVARDGNDGSDTATADMGLLGVELKYIEGTKSIGEAYDPVRR